MIIKSSIDCWYHGKWNLSSLDASKSNKMLWVYLLIHSLDYFLAMQIFTKTLTGQTITLKLNLRILLIISQKIQDKEGASRSAAYFAASN